MCVAFAQNPCVRIQIEFNMTLFCDFSKFKWTFLSAQYHRAELKCFYGEIQEAWHVLCFPVAVFFMWHFHFNLQILHICMQFTVLSLNILPWTLYCSKWQVLCILLLIKQKILKYCCGRLGPDFSINGMLSKQHAQHLEEFAISCECSFLHLYHCNSEKATTLVQQSTSVRIEGRTALYFKTKTGWTLNINIHSSL